MSADIQETTPSLLINHHERKHNDHSGGTVQDTDKCTPSQCGTTLRTPPTPLLGVDVRDNNVNLPASVNSIAGVLGDKNVNASVSAYGGEPGKRKVVPSAQTLAVREPIP